LFAAPLAAEAQPAAKVWRIGYLKADPPNSAKPFLDGLNELGYVEGRDFVMEYRWAEGHLDRLPGFAADLVRAHVDVILTNGTTATLAAKQATRSIPIVFWVAGRVVDRGLVADLAHPGGNVTGLQLQLPGSKLLQLLKDAVPSITRVVYLYDPALRPEEA